MKCLLYIRDGLDSFFLSGPHPTYRLALESAWSLDRRGFFIIVTGNRIPSRATQLGEADDIYLKRKGRKDVLRNRAAIPDKD